MKIFKRVLSILLVSSFSIIFFTQIVSAYIGNIQLPEEQKQHYLELLKVRGIPLKSANGKYEVNLQIYGMTKKVVYGKPSDVPDNRWKEVTIDSSILFEGTEGMITTNLPECWGYTYNEFVFTNRYFPDDAVGSVPPERWNFIKIPGARDSWKKCPIELLEYNMNTKLIGHGSTTLTVKDIGIDKALLQCPAGLFTRGSIKIEHIVY